ncbi:hypothetical protein IMZ48_30245 [Candidatus Bathyarchaeota archaeon]|nr:hypothetical protein [Candidatus Bathyarchaeota archaeon]
MEEEEEKKRCSSLGWCAVPVYIDESFQATVLGAGGRHCVLLLMAPSSSWGGEQRNEDIVKGGSKKVKRVKKVKKK